MWKNEIILNFGKKTEIKHCISVETRRMVDNRGETEIGQHNKQGSMED